MKLFLVFLLSCVSVLFPSLAADPENLADWKLGEVQIGQPFTHEELKGQVVILEYWGAW